MLPPLQPVAAAEQLTADIKAGRLEVAPALLSDFRLLPRPDDQLTVKVNGSKGRNANEFYCRSLMTMHPQNRGRGRHRSSRRDSSRRG